MHEAILNFNKQFAFIPQIVNEENLPKKNGFIVVGMGGSALAAKLLKIQNPELNILIRQDYGLPQIALSSLKDKLVILSSYSGNTEEVIDAFHQAKEKGLDLAVIAVGGELLKLAKENKVPYIELPQTGIQPRVALGFSIIAFLKMVGQEEELKSIAALAENLNPAKYEAQGQELAKKTKDCVPIIYTSEKNMAIVYNWKIKLNETGKVPAFYNVLPELNHNEMTGFDVAETTRGLSKNFYFLILRDTDDNPKILKRMEVLAKLYESRGLKVETLNIEGANLWEKIFSSLVLADWTAYYTAEQYGVEAEQVPMVEEFKKLILE